MNLKRKRTALENPAEKIQSSFGMFLFANRDLLEIQEILIWEELSKYINTETTTFASGKNKNDYKKLIEANRIGACGYHMEIMQVALQEYMKKLQVEEDLRLYDLQKYLFLLRCAILHTPGTLIAAWKSERREPSKKEILSIERLETRGLILKIPIVSGKELKDDSFSEASKEFKKLTFKIKLKRSNDKSEPHPMVRLNPGLIEKLILLSYHVLTITKKKKMATLQRYLERTTVKSKQ